VSADLPEGFGALEPHLGWALETERERADRRSMSSFAEVKAFYDAAFPLAPQALELLNDHTVADLEGPTRTLFLMMLSFTEAAFAVEAYGQVQVVMGLPVSRFERIPNLSGTF
jgi:hypothetical protein